MKACFIMSFICSLGSTQNPKNIHESYYSDLQDYPDAELDALFRSSSEARDAYQNQFGSIKEAQKSILSATRSIDSLFLRLPSLKELDKMILAADSVSLYKTIQTVATDDSLPCGQRIAYLLELLGRIKCAIQKKDFLANSLKVIIQGAFREIQRLQTDIERLSNEKKQLWLKELQDELASLVQDIENIYQRFNAIQRQINPLEAKIQGQEEQIKILSRNSEAQRNRIVQQKLKISESEAIINDLENKVRVAKDKKSVLEVNIQTSENKIEQNERSIGEDRKKLRQLERDIRNLQDQADSLKGQYSTFQIKVERFRTDISVAQAKQNKFNTLIGRTSNKINEEKKKIVQDQLDNLNHLISILKQLAPKTEKQIDRHYYYCYGQGSFEVKKVGDVLVYVISGQEFGDYIRKSYGEIVPVGKGDIEFSTVNIFGPAWIRKYGYPFVDSSLRGKHFRFNHDFSCLSESSVERGCGSIDQIDENGLTVTSQSGRHLKLSVGACSRIESVTSLPKTGQRICYHAISFENTYGILKASCW